MSLNKPIIFETTFTRYTGTDIIGQGGAGHIYQATDAAGDVYAIKLLDSEKAKSEKTRRFKNEVLFSFRNQHQNIITIVDYGVFITNNKRSPFYVMPLYKEGSLRKLIATGIQPNKVLFYFAQILDGVEAAHLQKVLHRDLKPENVLYDTVQDRLLIADFGIAHFEEEALYTNVKTSPNTRLANFQYAAPEQRDRGAEVDHRADIYALGLILNEMFTGKVPHGTGYKTIGSVAPEYGYLDEIVSRMLRQSADERPASIEIIKQPLIDRKLEFVTHQYISKVKQMVVSATDPDVPLPINQTHSKSPKAEVNSYFDVCVVCALAEEAKAFMHVTGNYCNAQFTRGISKRTGSYFYITVRNKEEMPFTIHVSCLPNPGPIETALHLKPVLEEFRPRFVVMTGGCAGYEHRVKLGDLVVADRAFSLDTGKVVIDVGGDINHMYGTATYDCTPRVLHFARMFDSWRSEIANLSRPGQQPFEMPMVHISPMASSGIIRSDNPFPTMQDIVRGTIALDMESAVFYRIMRDFPNIHSLLVKGITDYANAQARVSDSYHLYAAEASAAYALSFMKEYITLERLLFPNN